MPRGFLCKKKERLALMQTILNGIDFAKIAKLVQYNGVFH